MNRGLVSLLLLSLLLAACGPAADKPAQWGNLAVELARPAANPDHWTAVLQVRNPTTSIQPIQYTQPHKLTIIVTKDGKEIYRAPSDPVAQGELLNISPGAPAEHRVTWTYKDQEGKAVPRGTYQLKVELHAVTRGVEGGPVVRPVDVTVR